MRQQDLSELSNICDKVPTVQFIIGSTGNAATWALGEEPY